MEIVFWGGSGFEQRLIRGAGPEALFARLVTSSFGLPPGSSIFDDFPVWREDCGASIRRLGFFSDQKLAATAGLRLGALRVGSRKVPIGIIGCVATAEEHRGKGLATRLIESLVSSARDEGAALVILFGSEPDLYARLGFKHRGLQTRVALDSIPLSPIASVGMRSGKGWVRGLFEALKFRAGGLCLDAKDETWVSRHMNADWRWIAEGDLISAYACIGKGIDLQGMVHEWGGHEPLLHHLLTDIRSEIGGLQVLGCPGALSAAKLRSDQEVTEPLCMVMELDAGVARGVADSSEFWVWGLDGA